MLESLEALGKGQGVTNPNMVGYMLRGFFESYRRHLHWENAIVVPLARARLTREDIEELERTITELDKDLIAKVNAGLKAYLDLLDKVQLKAALKQAQDKAARLEGRVREVASRT